MVKDLGKEITEIFSTLVIFIIGIMILKELAMQSELAKLLGSIFLVTVVGMIIIIFIKIYKWLK